jgi:pimeloyl-ACP methyl ester carboxylesterase
MASGKNLRFGDITLATLELGPRNADVALLFVHGNSSSSRAFERQYSALGEYYLVSFDLPGHGASENARDASLYSLPAYAEIIYGIVSTIDTTKILLVGWSLGGHIVLEAMSDLPNSCMAVIVGAPPLRDVVDIPNAFLPSLALEVIQKGTVSEDDADLWARNCTHHRDAYPEWLRSDLLRTDPRARVALLTSLTQGLFRDEWEQISAASSRVSLVLGAEDPFINMAFLKDETLLKHLARPGVEIIPGAGHMAQWDAPEDFNRILLDRIRCL